MLLLRHRLFSGDGGRGGATAVLDVGKCPVKQSCLEGDNLPIEICRCRIEQFDRFINYRHFTGVAKVIRSLCRLSEVYDTTDRMSYPETQM